MGTGTRRALYVVFVVLAAAACYSACAGEPQQQKADRGAYNRFSNWGLSFEHPREWENYTASQVETMKQYVARELRPYGRNLAELAMLVGPNQEIALLVSKYTTVTAMTPAEFIKERNQVYADAKRAGDVTKVNHVTERVVATLPAVEEDVERSNGGRGRTLKIINGTTILEISFIATDGSQFPKYSAALDHLVSSIQVAGTGRP